MGVIYKATNTLNNKIYIGKTKRSLNKRMIDHITKANKGVVTHLYRAIRKYGKEAFKWEIVDTDYEYK